MTSMRKAILPIAVAALAGMQPSAASATNLIVNGQFRDNPWNIYGALTPAVEPFGLPGWTIIGEGIEYSLGGYLPGHGDYAYIDLAFSLSTGSPGGGIQQTINTIAGQTYDLGFWGINATDAYGRDGTGIVDVDIDGGTPIAFNVDRIAPPWNTSEDWTFYSTSFVAAGPTTTIAFRNHQNGLQHFAFIDDVSVTLAGAVPEPSSWAAMLLGFGMLGAMMRRRGAVQPLTLRKRIM